MQHTRRRLVATIGLIVTAQPAWAAFDLVTRAEYDRDRRAPEPPDVRAMPELDSPRIDLEAPAVDRPVNAPVDIRVRWSAAEGATIDPASFRLLYGRLEIDVTSRVAGEAEITASGVVARGAKIPAGSHRFTVVVADTRKRTGRAQFNVTVT